MLVCFDIMTRELELTYNLSMFIQGPAPYPWFILAILAAFGDILPFRRSLTVEA